MTTPLQTSTVGTQAIDAATSTSNLELTLQSMTSHRSVLGYILLSRSTPATIIRHSGTIFEGDQGKKYAAVIKRMADTVQAGLEEVSTSGGASQVVLNNIRCAAKVCQQDDIKFMRIRTKRHELLISPNDRYLIAILHDPALVA